MERPDRVEEEVPFLPNEIILHILSFLEVENLSHCALVSKTWHHLSNVRELWLQHFKKKNYNLFWLDDKTLSDESKAMDWKEIMEFFCKLEKTKEGTKIETKSEKNKDQSDSALTFVCITEENNGSCMARYRGEMRRGLKDGRGISEWGDGSRYEGQWQSGKRNGYGAYFWADGRKFVGQHVNDKRTYGKFFWPEGSTYEGEYKNSVRHGYGIFRWPNGDSYEGGWKEGGRFGRGKFCSANSEVFLQDWAEGIFDYGDRGPTWNKVEMKRKREDSPIEEENSPKRAK